MFVLVLIPFDLEIVVILDQISVWCCLQVLLIKKYVTLFCRLPQVYFCLCCTSLGEIAERMLSKVGDLEKRFQWRWSYRGCLRRWGVKPSANYVEKAG